MLQTAPGVDDNDDVMLALGAVDVEVETAPSTDDNMIVLGDVAADDDEIDDDIADDKVDASDG